MQFDQRGIRYSPPPKGSATSRDISATWRRDAIRRKVTVRFSTVDLRTIKNSPQVHLASQISGGEEWRALFRRFDSNQVPSFYTEGDAGTPTALNPSSQQDGILELCEFLAAGARLNGGRAVPARVDRGPRTRDLFAVTSRAAGNCRTLEAQRAQPRPENSIITPSI